MANLHAFEGKREATQYKAGGDEPLIAKIDLKVTQSMKDGLKAIPNWHSKLRDAIAQLIEAEGEKSEVRSQESGVRSQESGVRSQESGVRNPK